jgi:tetratricopeptide (TPR) repeat protein
MHPEVAVLKFLDAVDADLDSAGLRDVDAYVRDFPEHAERIRAEYERLVAAERTPDPAPLRRSIGGRYQVIESLGRGGFGEVFHAEDTQLARRVAIKVLAALRALSEEWRARLVREAEATNRVVDEGLCPVFDVGFDDGIPFLVMPWIPGRSLDRLLAASAARGEAPVQVAEGGGTLRQQRDAFLALVERIARTLHAAHEAGVVHRDVKPANILVRPDGRPVLIDFGLAWLESGEDGHSRTAALGTPAYSAPEVLRGERLAPDPRLDVWSLGAVLFEGLALRRPFVAKPGAPFEHRALDDPLPRLDPALGRDLQAVVETALARRPDDRYATMEAFADDLHRIRRDRPVGVRAAGPLRRLGAWVRARPRAVGFGTAGLALLATAVLTATTQWVRARERAVVVEVANVLAGHLEQTIRETEEMSRYGFAMAGLSQRAEDLLATVRGLRSGIGGAAEIDRCLARVLLATGGLHLRLGRWSEGSELNEEALQLLTALEDGGEADDEDRATIAHALILLGDARGHVGDVSGALERYRHAQAIDVGLMEAHPEDATRISGVGFGFLRIGSKLEGAGRLREALEETHRAVELLTRAEELAPDSIERRGHTAEAMLCAAHLMQHLGDPRPGIVDLLIEIEERLSEQSASFPRRTATWEARVNATKLRLALTEDPQQRLELSRQLVDHASKAADLESGAPYQLLELGMAMRAHAAELAAVGQLDAAIAASEAALSHAERALEASPRIGVFVDENINSMVGAREVYRAAGHADRADELNRKLAAFLTAELTQPDQAPATLARRASLLVDPELGEFVNPQPVLDLIEARRQALGDPGPEFVEVERKARAALR